MKKLSILSLLLLLFVACTSDIEETVSNETTKINNHGFVDLGLPSGTLWACTNVGANTPFEDGDYFAWGETEPKETYSRDNYKWGWPPTKYYGTNGKLTLDAEDDVATTKWGKNCRMPSKDEIQELCDICTWSWKNYNGTNGYMVKGPNGNQIFLPATGIKDEDCLSHNLIAYYLSNTGTEAFEVFPNGAFKYGLRLQEDKYELSEQMTYFGCSVRPVTKTDGEKPSDDNNKDDNQGDDNNTPEHYIQIKDGVVYNTDQSNKLLGSWCDLTYFIESNTYYSYELYSFDSSMRYKYNCKSLGSMTYEKESQGTYHYDDSYIYLVNDNGGSTKKVKYEWLSQNCIRIDKYKYFATSLKGLDNNDIPQKDEAGVYVHNVFRDNGDLEVTLIPQWGISKFFYTLSKDNNAVPTTSKTSPTIKIYSNLAPGEYYYMKTYGIDKYGITHAISTVPIKNLGTQGIKNRMVLYGENFNLISATMSQQHAAGTANRNWKTLEFSDGEGNELVFTYTNPYYEGIDKQWAEGTYKITTSNDCYQYNANFRSKSGKFDGVALDGKLTIKKTSSNYYVFDFDLDVLKGHFEGTVQ